MDSLDLIFSKSYEAFSRYRNMPPAARAGFLRAIADQVEKLDNELIRVCSEETNLPAARLVGERTRTCNQLRMFAALLEEGSWLEAVIDTALPDRVPIPRPDLRRMLFPIGPVVVFGAGNFPFAFSTAGGDTASALAAGCPVVYKGHPAHPKTSNMVAGAIGRAAVETGIPAEVFCHVDGGTDTGQLLVKHPLARAVAFTGSYAGGMAIYKTVSERKEPIPVYAEMGSVNPVMVLPGKLHAGAEDLAISIAQSVVLGSGQFCTKPGLVFLPESSNGNIFLEAMQHALLQSPANKMLHQGIAAAYLETLSVVLQSQGVECLVNQHADSGSGAPVLATTSAGNWLSNKALQNEVFGPFTLVVRYRHTSQLKQIIDKLEGQLTISLLGEGEDMAMIHELAVLARDKCGRLLFSGVPTGVEVSHAMTHGGPFPASTDSRSTSVGTYAIKRFARPVTYQSAPESVLPDALKNSNPLNILRLVNGSYTTQPID
jgi:2,5-dioxopentanoate dehydrogenase